MSANDQVHTKFKLFTGTLDATGHISTLAVQVTAWVKSAKVAPKSVGIEFVERAKRVILSVGYRDDEPAYNVALASSKIGSIGELDVGDLTKVEKAMGEAAAKQSHVICHELYVTDANELYVVTMSHTG